MVSIILSTFQFIVSVSFEPLFLTFKCKMFLATGLVFLFLINVFKENVRHLFLKAVFNLK